MSQAEQTAVHHHTNQAPSTIGEGEQAPAPPASVIQQHLPEYTQVPSSDADHPPYPQEPAPPPDYPPPPYPGTEAAAVVEDDAPAPEYPGPAVAPAQQVPAAYMGQTPTYVAPNQPYPPHDKMGMFAGFAAPVPGQQLMRTEYNSPASSCGVVTRQPRPLVVGGTVPTMVRTPKPNNWLALSVLTCMCFSPLFGLIAIFFSVMSDSAYHTGDVEGSKRNANTALGLSVFGIVVSTLVMAIMVFKVM